MSPRNHVLDGVELHQGKVFGGGGSGPLKAQKLPAAQYTAKKITNPDVNYNAPNWPVSH